MDSRSFADNIVIPYGYSGSGKGEIIKFLTGDAERKEYRLINLGSGDCFRETLATINGPGVLNDEQRRTKRILDETMLKGEFVPTLHAVISKLQSTFKDYILSTLNGEKVVLVLDGFLRVDQLTYTNPALDMHDVHIPSQIEQVSEIMARAFKEVVDDSNNIELIKRLDQKFVDQIRAHMSKDLLEVKREGLIETISEDVILPANHTFVDLPKEDAEVFMRYRASKSLAKISVIIKELEDMEEMSNELKDSRVLLEEATAIMSGHFEISEKGLEIKDMGKERWKHAFSNEEGGVSDEHIQRVAAAIFNLYGKEFDHENKVKFNLKAAVDLVYEDARKYTENPWNKKEHEVRADDALYENRKKRTDEFREKTLPGIIHKRLGLDLEYDNKVQGGSERLPIGFDISSTNLELTNYSLVINGVRVPFEELQRQAEVAGEKIFGNITSRLETESTDRERK